ncbi:MAG: alpha/beta hydrolase [Armatimonadaceae bacterium]
MRKHFLVCAFTGICLLGVPTLLWGKFQDTKNTAKNHTQEPPPLERTHTLTGNIQSHPDFPSRFLHKQHTVLVYLPPDYDAPGNAQRRYPTLYLHDGQNVFDGATSFIPGKEWQVDETAERLIRAGEIEPLIIVAIYNGGTARAYEYTPTRDDKFNGGMGGGANQYGRMLIEELKPFIDQTYRTRPDAASTGLGGSSFGGLVTLHLGLRHPDIFQRLAVVSPSVWWDRRYLLRAVAGLEKKPPVRLWLDMGTREGATALNDAQALRDALLEKGWMPGVDFHYMEAEGAVHDEAAWAARIEPILKYLYPPVK